MIKQAHVPECRHSIPIRTPYSTPKPGNDRIVRNHSDALALAFSRAPVRGRQTVRQHTGWLLKRVWVVQDMTAPSQEN
jgi:hypothetical protein